MIDFEKIGIDKITLNYNDKVLVLDICEYEEHNQVVLPFLATVKIDDGYNIFFDCEEDNMIYSDNEYYIVVKVL